MSGGSPERTTTGRMRLAYLCFGFCGFATLCLVSLMILASSDQELAGALGMAFAIFLGLPLALAAPLGVVLAFVLRRPRALLLLGGLTLLLLPSLVFSDWLLFNSDMFVVLSLLGYGVVALGVSGLWFFQGFRARQSGTQEPPYRFDAAWWEKNYQALVAFKAQEGHCNVPRDHPENPQLGTWLNEQQTLKRVGKFFPDRVARLDALGVVWDLNEKT